ncbi:MAG: DoxX family protein, partial [Deltaproteobacteria bacterium]
MFSARLGADLMRHALPFGQAAMSHLPYDFSRTRPSARLASRFEARASSRSVREETMASRLLRTDPDFAALFMRLALGLVFFPHGAQKVLGLFGGYGANATIQYFTKMGLPPWVTVLVMAAEFGGSILLILGFLTRIAAFGIGCV